MSARAGVLGLVVLCVACTSSGPPPTFAREDLPRLVLPASEAPKDTEVSDEGFLSVERLAEDQAEEDALRDAGFVAAYWRLFFDAKLYEKDSLDPGRALAVSYVVLFDPPEHAARGLAVIQDDIRSDGEELEEFPAEGLGEESFALYGTIDPDEPPGIVYGWRTGNVVQIFVALGAAGAINPQAARVLADRMLALTREPAPSVSPSATQTGPESTPSASRPS